MKLGGQLQQQSSSASAMTARKHGHAYMYCICCSMGGPQFLLSSISRASPILSYRRHYAIQNPSQVVTHFFPRWPTTQPLPRRRRHHRRCSIASSATTSTVWSDCTPRRHATRPSRTRPFGVGIGIITTMLLPKVRGVGA